MGEDFGSLYPNSMITMGLSPEAKIDTLQMNEDGFPATKEDEIKWQKYKKLGYGLSPMGRVYDMSKDFLYTRIEKKLLAQRKIFKGHIAKIYLDIIPRLEKEMERRGIKIPH